MVFQPASPVCLSFVHLSIRLSVQDPDVLRYHVIVGELLYPDHLSDGMLKSTLLGSDHQVQFHINMNNQVTIEL